MGIIIPKRMEVTNTHGFEELPHTADWELHVWAENFPALLETSARGMYALMGLVFDPQGTSSRRMVVIGQDRESQLVSFLGELLYYVESENTAFLPLSISINGNRVLATLAGRQVLAQTKEIKAVTYHNLSVRETANRLETVIVFDV